MSVGHWLDVVIARDKQLNISKVLFTSVYFNIVYFNIFAYLKYWATKCAKLFNTPACKGKQMIPEFFICCLIFIF